MPTFPPHIGNHLAQLLDMPCLAEIVMPFSISSIGKDEWAVGSFTQVAADRWLLKAHCPAGLAVEWHLQHYPDTRAIECWGELVHKGTEPHGRIREVSTWDANLVFTRVEGLPWIRRFNGATFVSVSFPPHDFRYSDHRLAETSQFYAPFEIAPSPDGRSSHRALPSAIICDGLGAKGMACWLEWSGLWRMQFRQEIVEYGIGTDLYRVHWNMALAGLDLDLEPGEKLPLPRVLITAFDGGLDAGGNTLRRHIRRHVTPQIGGAEMLPPTSFNHWFAFENNFTAASLAQAVTASAEIGLEYFCIDGGWFRDGFRRGIGNWEEGDPSRFPDGIKPFADFVVAQGMKYGTWFEPEFAHEGSDLYRAHPEWFWKTPPAAEVPAWCEVYPVFRDPEVHLMNFGLRAVQDWWVERIARAYDDWSVRWIRWDFNQIPRLNWDYGVPPGKIGWRQIEHITGLYATLDRIIARCPDLVIEHCASGGHRIDLGTVRRGHTFWMNDHTTNSDLVRAFQHGLNEVLPGNYPNTNLCQKRHDFTGYDFLSHGCGGFGYSGKLWEFPLADKARLQEAVARFKQYRHLLLEDYHRSTSQPKSAEDKAKVAFGNDSGMVRLQYNSPQAGDASCHLTT